MRDKRLPSTSGHSHSRSDWLTDERRAVEIDVRIELAGMKRRRDEPMLHLQQHFGQASDTGGGLGSDRCSISPSRSDTCPLRTSLATRTPCSAP